MTVGFERKTALPEVSLLRKVVTLGLFLLFVLGFSTGAFGATKNWIGGVSNWNASGNWSPSGVPGTGDSVVINTPGDAVTIDVNIAPFTFLDFTLASDATITPGVFTTLIASGNVTITTSTPGGWSTLLPLDMTGAGTTLNATQPLGQVTIDTTASVTLLAPLTLNGALDINSGGSLSVGGSNYQITDSGDWINARDIHRRDGPCAAQRRGACNDHDERIIVS